MLLLVAGHETTMSLVSTAVLLLLQRPDVAAEVRDDPTVAPAVVEETLRFMGPLQVASGGGRWPYEPVTMHDHTMQPGERVRLLLGAANRDERVFTDPDTFDLHRNNSRHVAFGKGLHFCVGAALGRLEGQVVIPAVLRRFPDLALVDETPNWRPGFVDASARVVAGQHLALTHRTPAQASFIVRSSMSTALVPVFVLPRASEKNS